MRKNPRLFRLSASVALGALLCNAALPAVATAQPAPPAAQFDQNQADQNQGDPPSRVGRIAGLTGTVSFRTTDDTQWNAASANYPVSSGDAFWTEPRAEANLEISDSRVALADQTEFVVNTLDAGGLQAVAPQGETYLHLGDLAPNEAWSVQTPRGMVRMTANGRYDVVVGSTDQPTLLTVLDGAAEIDGPGVSLRVAANQTASVSGTDTFQGSIGPAQRDAFLNARLTAERPPPRPAGIPPQVAYMPGGSDLAGYGNWSRAPQYGEVWYPPVQASWVPYREGHWAYVAPWGWTWVDNAPWGFAPFHYGRWVRIDDRWGWTPGVERAVGPPVYAPALVTFVGLAAGAAVGAAIAGGSIGWVPLGPREAYHPWYHASDNYVRQVNISHVTNVTNITTINNYVNRGAATSVPAAVMTGSRPVQAAAQPVSAQAFAAAHPVVGQQPMRPTAATAGVTPVVARQLNLAPVGAARRVAPGPVVPAQPPARSGGTPARPALVGPRGERPGAPHPAAAVVPAPNGVREPGRPAAPLPLVVQPPEGRPALTAAPGPRPPGAAEPRMVHPAPVPGRAPEPVVRSAATPPSRPAATETPRVVVPTAPRTEAIRPAPEMPHAAPPPHVEAVRPAPETPHAPPPARAEAVRPAPEAPRAPAPQRVEAMRPAPPPPRAAQAEREKKPGEPR
ncbi:DUF6600 domain-containing protein [Rhodopila sp.]|uniref:DUF6600 domain-containing protein n=1 Tax=Rhodopila sp. TaxID=2480087 RepID=UPI003D0E11F8